jgi:ABC-type branched-subunit amino acid transport system substrate-binding protein
MGHLTQASLGLSDVAARVARLPFEVDSDPDVFSRNKAKYYRIALPVPLCGTAGLWTPSCIASAQVAVEELNRQNGIAGREVQLVMVDAAAEAATPVEAVVNDLIENDAIDAIVGMHISAVRQRLSKVVRQRVPFVYTPLYEGGETTPGIFAIGETPDLQLGPAMDFLQEKYAIKRWALIGNDYVWPRVSHAFARQKIKWLGGELACERYVPLGVKDMRPLLEELEVSRPDAVLISLVGQDAVAFNRLFGKMELHRKMVRISSALEENGLLATGAACVKRLYSVSSYFGSLKTETNAAFREKYHTIHGENAPTLNSLGQSTYEGVQYLASLIANHATDWRSLSWKQAAAIGYRSARWIPAGRQGEKSMPMYMACAAGVQFEILKDI